MKKILCSLLAIFIFSVSCCQNYETMAYTENTAKLLSVPIYSETPPVEGIYLVKRHEPGSYVFFSRKNISDSFALFIFVTAWSMDQQVTKKFTKEGVNIVEARDAVMTARFKKRFPFDKEKKWWLKKMSPQKIKRLAQKKEVWLFEPKF